MHLGDAATLNLTLICDQLRSELRAHQQNMRFNRDRPSEWQSRISRQEETLKKEGYKMVFPVAY